MNFGDENKELKNKEKERCTVLYHIDSVEVKFFDNSLSYLKPYTIYKVQSSFVFYIFESECNCMDKGDGKRFRRVEETFTVERRFSTFLRVYKILLNFPSLILAPFPSKRYLDYLDLEVVFERRKAFASFLTDLVKESHPFVRELLFFFLTCKANEFPKALRKFPTGEISIDSNYNSVLSRYFAFVPNLDFSHFVHFAEKVVQGVLGEYESLCFPPCQFSPSFSLSLSHSLPYPFKLLHHSFNPSSVSCESETEFKFTKEESKQLFGYRETVTTMKESSNDANQKIIEVNVKLRKYLNEIEQLQKNLERFEETFKSTLFSIELLFYGRRNPLFDKESIRSFLKVSKFIWCYYNFDCNGNGENGNCVFGSMGKGKEVKFKVEIEKLMNVFLEQYKLLNELNNTLLATKEEIFEFQKKVQFVENFERKFGFYNIVENKAKVLIGKHNNLLLRSNKQYKKNIETNKKRLEQVIRASKTLKSLLIFYFEKNLKIFFNEKYLPFEQNVKEYFYEIKVFLKNYLNSLICINNNENIVCSSGSNSGGDIHDKLSKAKIYIFNNTEDIQLRY